MRKANENSPSKFFMKFLQHRETVNMLFTEKYDSDVDTPNVCEEILLQLGKEPILCFFDEYYWLSVLKTKWV